MKKNLLIIIALLSTYLSQAQYSYSPAVKTEKVELSYKWKNTVLFDTDSELELALKIKNRNDSAVLISFSVDYYINGRLDAITEITDYCLAAKKTARGEYNGLILTSKGKTEELIKSDAFELHFNNFSVTKTGDCDDKD
jgi:hypothetical protein